MALLISVNEKGKYADDNALNDVIQYIFSPYKCVSGYIGGAEVDMLNPAESMKTVALRFNKFKGIRLRHFVINFLPKEISDSKIAFQIAQLISQAIGYDFQNVFAIHENKECIHFHLVFNAISYVDGKRYHDTKEERQLLKSVVSTYLKRYGITDFLCINC